MINVYLKYTAMVILDLLSGVVNLILAPIIVMFADKDGWLPRWLWWFQTPGDSLFGSIGWQTEDAWFIPQDTMWKVWLNRIGWLYRNSMYGFAISVLGVQSKEGDEVIMTGDPATNNHKKTFHPGTIRYTLYRDGQPIAFQIYIIKPLIFGRYFRGNFGWKLWDFPTPLPMQFTFSPNPFRTIPK